MHDSFTKMMISRITLVMRLISLCTLLCVMIGCSFLHGLIARWRLLSKEELGHAGSFKSILFFDEQNGVALNALGLAQTTDGGRSWDWLLDSGNRGFYSMRFIDRQQGWIVGAQHDTDEERPAMSVRRSPLILRTEGCGTGESPITSGGGVTTFKFDLPPVRSVTVGGQAVWNSSWQKLDIEKIRANRAAAIASGLKKDPRYAARLDSPIQ
jgi:hypothetical protein